MSTFTRAKIALAVVGLVLFFIGVRIERTELRWAGLGFVAVAWLMRFVKRPAAGEKAERRD